MEIQLFADGSYSPEVGVGSWAFRIPTLGLEGVGVEAGKTSGRFEALAVLNGLEGAHSLGLRATVRVLTDSEEVVTFVARLVGLTGASLPAKAAKGKVDLVRRFQDAICDRRVAVTKYSGGSSMDHQWCHKSARRALH